MTFGFARAEIVAALINFTTLILLGLYLGYAAIMHLFDPQPVAGWKRHVTAALTASLIKTDRRDTRGIANRLRLGWFKPVHVKAASVRERRVLLAARDRRMRDLANAVRGLLRDFGLRPPRLLRQRWSHAVRDLIAGHATLTASIKPILNAREALALAFERLDKLVPD